MESATTFGLGAPQAGGAAAPRFPGVDERQWQALITLVGSEYPYCKMFGVQVVNGCVVGCEAIQQSFPFAAKSAGVNTESPLDAHWKTLLSLCAKIGTGRLDEIRFNAGRPVAAFAREGGRRFRQRLTRILEAERPPERMS